MKHLVVRSCLATLVLLGIVGCNHSAPISLAPAQATNRLSTYKPRYYRPGAQVYLDTSQAPGVDQLVGGDLQKVVNECGMSVSDADLVTDFTIHLVGNSKQVYVYLSHESFPGEKLWQVSASAGDFQLVVNSLRSFLKEKITHKD